MKVVALICCRGGSKGIPGKNIKMFSGKPLLQWVIDSAKKSKVFDTIYLSTDCSDIAAVGTDAGAVVPELRPQHLATDSSVSYPKTPTTFAF